MSWKKRFAPTMRLGELCAIGPIRIMKEPENLGQGKYRVRAEKQAGGEVQFTTFEGTIGNILKAQGAKGYAEAYESKELNSKGFPYINWRAVEP